MKFIHERTALNTWRFYVNDTETFQAGVACFEQPSPFGINGGRVSKLFIMDKKTNEIVCDYDRGWDKKPTKKVKDFYEEILRELN